MDLKRLSSHASHNSVNTKNKKINNKIKIRFNLDELNRTGRGSDEIGMN